MEISTVHKFKIKSMQFMTMNQRTHLHTKFLRKTNNQMLISNAIFKQQP